MKRIYLALALVGGLAFGAKAQTYADLESVVVMHENACISLNDTIQGTDTAAADYGLFGVINNGPATIFADEVINMIFPICDVSATGAQVYPATLTADAAGGDPAIVLSTFPVSLIKTLLNIDSFEAGANQFSSLLVPRASLVTGKIYGFYVYTIGVGEDIANPDNTDTITSNNFVYVPIKWDCNLSVNEMIKGAKKESLTVYPNPASTEVNFDYIFDANSTTAVARITDITGRTVLVKDFGKSNGFGTRKFKVDVSALPAGTYIMEFSTDNKRAVSKFSIK